MPGVLFLTHYFENFLCKHLVTIHQQMVSNKRRMKPGAVSWLLWRGIWRGLGDVMLFSVRQHPDVMLGGLETSGNTALWTQTSHELLPTPIPPIPSSQGTRQKYPPSASLGATVSRTLHFLGTLPSFPPFLASVPQILGAWRQRERGRGAGSTWLPPRHTP